MADISGINGLGASMWDNVGQAAPKSAAPESVGDFTDAIKDAVGNVEADQKTQNLAIQDLVTGRSHDVLPVVQAVADADLSFKLLMGVRNKVVEAYKQTIMMQV